MQLKRTTEYFIAVFLILILFNASQSQISSRQDSNNSSLNSLLEELKDLDPKVRQHAAEELGKLGDRSAVNPLILALNYDDVYRVRKAAAWALGELKDEKAVIPLMRAISHSDWIVRANAAEALGKIGDPLPVAALTDTLEDENHNVIQKVVWALGEIGLERAVNPLVDTLTSKIPNIRSETAKALGKIKDRRSVPHLISLLRSERSPEVRKWTVWALGEMPNGDAIRSLAMALEDENYSVRLQAQVSLEKVGVEAVPFLIEALRHEKLYVRNRALWALEEITGQRYGPDAALWEKWMNELR